MKAYRIKQIIAVLVLLTVAGSFNAFASSGKSSEIDLKENPIYKVYSFNQLLSISKGGSSELYENDHFVVNAVIDSIGKDGKTLTVKASKNSVDKVSLKAESTYAVGEVKRHSVNDSVRVYGTFSGSLVSQKLSLVVDELKETGSTDIASGYEFSVGNGYPAKSVAALSVGNGKVKCSIPKTWKAVEAEADNGLDGYKYCLNNIGSGKKNDAELVYLFHFDYDRYVYAIDRSDDNLIEKAIIKNILPDETFGVGGTYVRSNQKLFGKTVDHYITRYTPQAGTGYNVEFFFTKAGSDGLACMVYVYGQPVHKEDVIYVLRTLETSD